MKLTADLIARTALRLLDDAGLDGLTMRLVATELEVKAPALYWHVKNKQELLDAMAAIMLAEAGADLELPGRDVPWDEWLGDEVRRLRRVMLAHRDGARVLAGTHVTDPGLFRKMELTLRTLVDAGFDLRVAARSYPALLHYTIGFTIEEQARAGTAYQDANPYESVATLVDPERFPLTARAMPDVFDRDTDDAFEAGLHVILAGLRAVHSAAR
ncbi:TetR/AcrR family transcriptional regulator C-terminal domain-containing protein [Longispora sp. NPDC051575]|uniref:TetR/AcrR family transcriptional regulator C-terminal domain-containing protein n=1 Tax=Longispora sp. NPDC051575 TaxID=3154943 RepID=UPI003413AA49